MNLLLPQIESCEPTLGSEVKRGSQRGRFDKAPLRALLDEAFLCPVSFVFEDRGMMIPTAFGRHGEKLQLHSTLLTRMLLTLEAQRPPRQQRRENGSSQS